MEEIERKVKNGKYFLRLLRAALSGTGADVPDDADLMYIIRLAEEQKVLPMILEAAWQSPTMPPELLAYLRNRSFRIVIDQAQRTEAFLRLYQALAEKNLRPAVLKGIICRDLYPQPDQRPSGDEDLLILPEELTAVHDALLSHGLHCESDEISASMHEITYSAPYMRIELHLSCFPSDSAVNKELNAVFAGAMQRTVTRSVNGTTLRTLAPTDHFLYLLCHAYKHFLHSGIGIRQVADMGVYANAYNAEIDWKRVYASCRKVKIETFAAALLIIAHTYLTLSAVPAPFSEIKIDEEALLRDILAGGVYGGADPSRQHSSNMTLDAVEADRTGQKGRGVWRSLFPGKAYLMSQFPYAKKLPILLPAAWVHRLIRYAKRDENEKGDPGQTIQIGQERIGLLRKYRIIDRR